MEYVDYGNPAYDDDYENECMHCGKPIEKKGYCSNNCFDADMLWDLQ